MELASVDVHAVAKRVGISYQAVMKVLNGTTKMLKADNNVVAARFMGVDPDWLATGEGEPRGSRVWPLSPELLAACRAAGPVELRRAENAARGALDMDALPRVDPSEKQHAAAA